MPNPPQGRATFPGINQIVSASMSFVHGISPSVATLVIAPIASFPAIGGELRFTYDNVTVKFPDCKVDQHSFRRNGEGLIWQLSVWDRRWKWRWGQISGHYNLHNADGTIKKGTDKKPQELAKLCLDAIKEQDYDVSALPEWPEESTYPETHWEYNVPMECLAQLCDALGCRVVLQLDNTIKICKTGEGASLPVTANDVVLENSLTIDPPEKPKRIAIVTAPSLWQVDLKLEAVGMEQDSTIKRIDDLSWKPSAWHDVDVPWCNQIASNYAGDSDEEATLERAEALREIAKKCLFKWYRIALPFLVEDHLEAITSYEQFLPVQDNQVDTLQQLITDPTSGDSHTIVKPKPAIVYGVWYDGLDGTLKNVVAKIKPVVLDLPELNASIVRRPFTIDVDRGIVVFDEPVYKNALDTAPTVEPDEMQYAAAELRLRCAISLRWKEPQSTGEEDFDLGRLAYRRYVKGRATKVEGQQPPETPTRYVMHDELSFTRVPIYQASTNEFDAFVQSGWLTNREDLDKACDHYLDGLEAEYERPLPQTVKYGGLKYIELDGAISQIVLVVGKRGATTIVTRNTEHIHWTLPYQQRRTAEIGRQVLRQQMKFMGENLGKAIDAVTSWWKKL
mgnify:CR=1 FL=1